MGTTQACLLFMLFGICMGKPQPADPMPLDDIQATRFINDPVEFARQAELALGATATAITRLNWNYESNITEYNEKQKLDFQTRYDAFVLTMGKTAKGMDVSQVRDQAVRRKLKAVTAMIGTSILEGSESDVFNKLVSDMTKTFSTAKVPKYKEPTTEVSLEPEMTLRMAESRDPEELKHYWKAHRQSTGAQIRDMYKDYIKMVNKAAKLNGFESGTEMKIEPYESDNFLTEMADTWKGLKPLYDQLHAYVRDKLHKHYGCDVVTKAGPMSSHVLGNMWAQSWGNIADLVRPFPDKPSLDVTEAMKSKGWTAKTMFEKAEDFFVSIGFEPMTEKFWNRSIIEKPSDRDMVCHASAWDFYQDDDFRIKMCTRVNQEDFVTVNHEMGHVQYFMRYRNQSFLFRNGANPGFHEAVADILSLAVRTPTYFKRLGLLDDKFDVTDKETNINILFNMALDRIAFLPFGYLVDKYRWDLMSGKVSEDDMNCHWHQLRAEIQGIVPPEMRYEDTFDAGAKYHVAADIGYVRYFTAFIYEFQFYKALCLESGQYDPRDPKKPLHLCNFYGNKKAGQLLDSMLKLGSSLPWKSAMRVITGSPDMDTRAIREYFKPLEDWLKAENYKNEIEVGWNNPEVHTYCRKERPKF